MNKLFITIIVGLTFSINSVRAEDNSIEIEGNLGLAKGSENGKDNNPGQAKGSENGKDSNPGQAKGSENGKDNNPGLAKGDENENTGPDEDSPAQDNADCNSSFKREFEDCEDKSSGNSDDILEVSEEVEPEAANDDETEAEEVEAVSDEAEVNFEDETLVIPCLKVKNSAFDGIYKVELKMMDEGNAAFWTVEGAEFVSEKMGECKKALNAHSNLKEEEVEA